MTKIHNSTERSLRCIQCIQCLTYTHTFELKLHLLDLLGRPTLSSTDLGYTAILLHLLPSILFSSATLRADWTELNHHHHHFILPTNKNTTFNNTNQRSDSCFYATYRAFINCFSSSSNWNTLAGRQKNIKFMKLAPQYYKIISTHNKDN